MKQFIKLFGIAVITAATVTTISTANGYRLPTEAQWEYACRVGGSEEVTITEATGWYSINSNSKTHQVGLKTANAWKLYDMLGNVWEWCWDWYGAYTDSAKTDPVGASSGTNRVKRGGSWNNDAENARSAIRNNDNNENNRDNNLGFRLLRP